VHAKKFGDHGGLIIDSLEWLWQDKSKAFGLKNNMRTKEWAAQGLIPMPPLSARNRVDQTR